MTGGLQSATSVQRTFKTCTIEVFIAGTTNHATLYSDNAGTPLGNPFTNQNTSTGQFFFFALSGYYDVKISASGLTTYTLSAIGLNTSGVTVNCVSSSGADAGAKIIKCISALPITGGIADATGFQGPQAINADIFAGVTKPGELRVCSATFTVSNYTTVPSNWTVRGCGQSSQFYAPSELPLIPAIGSASAVLYIAANAVNVTLRDLFVQGPYSGTGTSGTTFGIYAGTNTTNIQILNSIVKNASWSGIHLFTGSRMLAQGNYTEHNAIDGIESWASDTDIVDNRSYDDAAASANGVGCAEILPGAARVNVVNEQCTSSNHQGIVISSGGAAQDTITIANAQVYSPGTRGIVDNAGSTNLKIVNSNVVSPRGSGALGYGIYIANTVGFQVVNNFVTGATVGSGPAGIQLDGTCDDGIVANNRSVANWVGFVVTGSCGTNKPITISNNTFASSSSGLDYSNSSSGAKVFRPCNAIGTTTLTCEFPSMTVPQITGGSAVGSSLTLQGTSANGTATVSAINFNVGNNGGTHAGGICNNGNVWFGTFGCSFEPFAVVDTVVSVRSTTSSDAKQIWYNSNGSGRAYGAHSINDGTFAFKDDTANNTIWGANSTRLFGIATLDTSTGTHFCQGANLSGFISLAGCTSLLSHKNLERKIAADQALDLVSQLTPYQFNWKANKRESFGLIADYTENVSDRLVTRNRDKSLQGVDYDAVVALLVRAVQEQQKQINELKRR